MIGHLLGFGAERGSNNHFGAGFVYALVRKFRCATDDE